MQRTPPRPTRIAWVPALKTAGVVVAIAFVLGSGVVPCAFARATHLPCPGCGSTRSVHALLQGDLDGALRGNPLGPVMAFALALLAIDALVVAARDGSGERVGRTRAGRALARALVVVAALEVVLWIARFFGAFGGPVPV